MLFISPTHLERVLLQDALLQVHRKKLAHVVPRVAEGHLRQVVGAEGEELGGLGDLSRHQRRPGHLNHGAHPVLDLGTTGGKRDSRAWLLLGLRGSVAMAEGPERCAANRMERTEGPYQPHAHLNILLPHCNVQRA